MPQAKESPQTAKLREDPHARRDLRTALTRWFRRTGRDLPWRRTHDPYAILVSEMMLQQTQVATVIPYYERWLERFPDFAALAAADESEVLHAWQGLGYYARARNLHRAAKWITDQWSGRMPQDPTEIATLPGIGRYTAGAVASFAFDRPVAAVDANIARVIARLFDLHEPIDTGRGQAALWAAAERLLPVKGGRLHNSALMELGALVCTPRSPECQQCPVHAYCAADSPEELPRKKARRATATMTEDCGWTVIDCRLLLERQDGKRWRGLWKLPPLAEGAARGVPVWEAVYPFTHHRVTLRVFPAKAPRVFAENLAWFSAADLAATALTAPHRRAVEGLIASPSPKTSSLQPPA